MIRIAVVEDEDIYAQQIEKYLYQYEKEYAEEIQVFRYRDGYAIAEEYRLDYDIILMDIEMGIMNGMEAAVEIRKRDTQVVIIFITNMAQYAIQGYQVGALDYILKPIQYMPFAQSLKKAIWGLEKKREQYLIIRQRDSVIKLRSTEIGWIESKGHLLTFHTEEKTYETTIYSMKDLEKELKDSGFSRCNSGILVNLRYVKGVEKGYVHVYHDHLPISRGRKQDFMNALTSFLSR